MIEARPSPLFKAWFGRHAQRRVLSTFGAVRVRGLDRLDAACARGPVLVVSNHTSWWDPMFCILLSTRLMPVEGYALMEASNLRRLPFLGRLGGFGVERNGDTREVLRYAAGLLDRPRRLVWIFPQGRERPLTERPLRFERGAAMVAQLAPQAQVIPAALRYEFGPAEAPDLYASFGDAMAPAGDTRTMTESQRQRVEDELDRIDRAIRGGGDDEFDVVLTRSASWLGQVAERMLARLTRYESTPPNLRSITP